MDKMLSVAMIPLITSVYWFDSILAHYSSGTTRLPPLHRLFQDSTQKRLDQEIDIEGEYSRTAAVELKVSWPADKTKTITDTLKGEHKKASNVAVTTCDRYHLLGQRLQNSQSIGK
ncbi:hypothetical protein KIN20_020232, partial [Parelaphostrongylus tenuis]